MRPLFQKIYQLPDHQQGGFMRYLFLFALCLFSTSVLAQVDTSIYFNGQHQQSQYIPQPVYIAPPMQPAQPMLVPQSPRNSMGNVFMNPTPQPQQQVCRVVGNRMLCN
jgi:hypothetical protein